MAKRLLVEYLCLIAFMFFYLMALIKTEDLALIPIEALIIATVISGVSYRILLFIGTRKHAVLLLIITSVLYFSFINNINYNSIGISMDSLFGFAFVMWVCETSLVVMEAREYKEYREEKKLNKIKKAKRMKKHLDEIEYEEISPDGMVIRTGTIRKTKSNKKM